MSFKFDQVGKAPRRGFWVLLFVICLIMIGALGTTYQWVLIQNFEALSHRWDFPWITVVFGTAGFCVLVGAMILFYLRLLKEMKISQVQADFLDRISHELRTPLAAIRLTSDLIEDSMPSTEDTKKLWEIHHQELSRLTREVEAMLEAARWRSGKIPVKKTWINLDQFIASVRGSFEKESGLTVKTQIPAGAGMIWADEGLLELTLRNLLENARKFSKDKTDVSLNVGKNSNQWWIEVSDQGRGFTKKDEERLFKKFNRLPDRSNGNKKSEIETIPGVGLGLFLSASACRAMNFSLRGESPGPNRGATFRITGRLNA